MQYGPSIRLRRSFGSTEQIANIGRTGATDPKLTVFSATMAQQKAASSWMTARKDV